MQSKRSLARRPIPFRILIAGSIVGPDSGGSCGGGGKKGSPAAQCVWLRASWRDHDSMI